MRWRVSWPRLLLLGLSLMLHFGVFNVLAGLWRRAGVDARPLFRAPLAARSLADFWGSALEPGLLGDDGLAVYRPLTGRLGRKGATAAAFLASGLLHELAISVPVLAGFGLPLCYFLLHGGWCWPSAGWSKPDTPSPAGAGGRMSGWWAGSRCRCRSCSIRRSCAA